MKRKYLSYVILLAATVIAGCTLDPAFEGVYCPEDHSESLGYINYYGTTCRAENCHSEADCCGIPDSDAAMRKQIWESINYSRCPAGSNFSECGHDGESYFCYNGCPGNMNLCGGICVYFDQTKIDHCDGAKVVCVDGNLDCDGNIENGCEVDANDKHLKSCHPEISEGEVTIVVECADGYGNCNSKDECNVNLDNTRMHCGECGHLCESDKPVCRFGECWPECEADELYCNGRCLNRSDLHFTDCRPNSDEMICEAGYENCDETILNGCEVNITLSDSNCGECHHSCDTGEECFEGNCRKGTCKDETLNFCLVDGHRQCLNANTGNDMDHCGSCETKCSDILVKNAVPTSCEAGHCIFACISGYVNVGKNNTADEIHCIDPLTDKDFCGYRLEPKPNMPGGANAPDTPPCDPEDENCKPDDTPCDNSDPDNLCTDEPDTPADDPEYEATYETCTNNDICQNGVCVTNNCGENQVSCIVNALNETACIDIKSDDENHCGACGYKCSDHLVQNAISSQCENGACIYKCLPGFINVGEGNGFKTIHCIDPTTSNAYCGAVSSTNPGSPCEGSTICYHGKCIENNCDPGYVLCSTPYDEIGKCINLRAAIDDNKVSDDDRDSNCGACGYKCIDHPLKNAYSDTCDRGVCQYTCKDGYVNVGTGNTALTIKCVEPQTDTNYCGATDQTHGERCDVKISSLCKISEVYGDKTYTFIDDYGYGVDYNGGPENGIRTGRICDTSNEHLCLDYKCTEIAEGDEGTRSCSWIECITPRVNCTEYRCDYGNDCGDNCCEQYSQNGFTIEQFACDNDKACAGTVCTENNLCTEILCADGHCTWITCDRPTTCVNGVCAENICDANTPDLCSNGKDAPFCTNIHDNPYSCGACNYSCLDHLPDNAIAIGCVNGECQYQCRDDKIDSSDNAKDRFINVGTGNTFQTIKCIDWSMDVNYCGAKLKESQSSVEPNDGNHSDSGNDELAPGDLESRGEICASGEMCVAGICQRNICTNETDTQCKTKDGRDICVNLYSDNTDHCGSCNFRCSEQSKENATSNACDNGSCQYKCDDGYVNIGENVTADSIKCVDPKNNKAYCGAESYENKGQRCSNNESCVEAKCVIHSCNDSYTLCNIDGTNTCINVESNDASHCGACNYSCSAHPIPNATSSTCSDGKCQYTCNDHYVNVGSGITASTILCINPQIDSEHCGATGNEAGAASESEAGEHCDEGKVCVNGVCVYHCSTNETLCNNTCSDLSNDESNCGECGFNCSEHTPDYAEFDKCSDGFCFYKCQDGYTNEAGEDMENLRLDVIHCI